ncbi:MAG: CpsD/CapB family tyrosine-protein kinase [Gammaproteobacteria bacterium]
MSAQWKRGSDTDLGQPVRTLLDHPSPAERSPALVPTARPDHSLVMAHSRQDHRGEEVRALRTELLLRWEPQDATRVVALLSPCAGDGRTQLAAELAIAFAQLGRPTLLVDADLRNPRQHVLFSTEREMGLSQALDLGVSPRVHAVEGIEQLFLVTAGLTPPNPLELLLNGGFESLLDEWRLRFDFIVLDTPPVTPFSDGLTVASVARHVLALTRADRTPYRDTRDMLRRLAATRADVLGAVISRF